MESWAPEYRRGKKNRSLISQTPHRIPSAFTRRFGPFGSGPVHFLLTSLFQLLLSLRSEAGAEFINHIILVRSLYTISPMWRSSHLCACLSDYLKGPRED